jgi:ABC-2 type transport system permease protein
VANSITGAMASLVGNGNLIKKVYFPREVLVGSAVAAFVITLLIELGVLVAFLLVAGNMALPWIPVALVLVVILTVMVLGWSLMLGIINVYLRDFEHFVPIALQALFYATPIVYPIRFVPETATLVGVEIPLRTLYKLNPLVHVVEALRDVFYDLRFPPATSMAYMVVWAVGSLALGLWVFSRGDRRLAEEV